MILDFIMSKRLANSKPRYYRSDKYQLVVASIFRVVITVIAMRFEEMLASFAIFRIIFPMMLVAG